MNYLKPKIHADKPESVLISSAYLYSHNMTKYHEILINVCLIILCCVLS